MRKLVAGVGINDASYPISTKEPYWVCPVYDVWKSMLWRVYKTSHTSDISYKDVVVCEEWKTFSNFEAWYRPRMFEGCRLDKDLKEASYIYSPETCLVIHNDTNKFLTNSVRANNDLLLGVCVNKGKYGKKDNVDISYLGKKKWLGTTNCIREAEILWLRAKSELCDHFMSVEIHSESREGLKDFKNKLETRIEELLN